MSAEKSQTQTLTFAVAAAAESPTETRVSARDFEFVVDEPQSLGGENAGPNPVEYVLGALAGCLNVTSHVVAREMDLDVRDLEIAIEGDLDPGKFMGKREDGAPATRRSASRSPPTSTPTPRPSARGSPRSKRAVRSATT
ncbi:OsmC family protein [Haloferax sp. S2CR25-2]|nr:OsmC family protein [Haloferax sp. S2CR25]MDS0445214.1 OsmC family protein [Haloferax sp. S2CR25-2]